MEKKEIEPGGDAHVCCQQPKTIKGMHDGKRKIGKQGHEPCTLTTKIDA